MSNIDSSLEDPLLDPNTENSQYISLQQKFNEIFNPKLSNSEKYVKFKTCFPSLSYLANNLNVHLNSGIDTADQDDILLRKKYFTKYEDTIKPQSQSLFYFIKIAFTDEILVDLINGSIIGGIVASFKDGILKGWIDSIIIMISVLIVAFISAFFNYRKQKKFIWLVERLNEKIILVRRNRHLTSIKISEILTGDIVKIQQGDSINLSGILIKGHLICRNISNNNLNDMKNDIELDSEDDNKNLIFANNNEILSVVEGEGDMLVILPDQSLFSIDESLQDKNSILYQYVKSEDLESDDSETSELNLEIHSVAEQIGNIGVIMGAILGITMLLKTIYNNYVLKFFSPLDFLMAVIDAWIMNETLKVVAIPEGLPMSSSVSLAFSIESMINDKILLNHINKIPSVAKMNYLLINKSTVTNGLPQVKEAFISGQVLTESNNCKDIIEDVLFNSSSKVEIEKGEKILSKNGNNSLFDNAVFLMLIDNCPKEFNANLMEESEFDRDNKIKLRIPFSHEYNYILSVVEGKEIKGKKNYKAFIKGYTDNVLNMCNNYVDKSSGNEVVKKIDDKIKNIIKDYDNKSYSVLILAEKNVDDCELKEDFYQDFTIKAILGIGESFQSNIKNSIKKCENCGIHLKMLTNDKILTSLKACEKINLIEKGDVSTTLKSLSSNEKISVGKISLFDIAQAANTIFRIGMYGDDFLNSIGGFTKINLKEENNNNDNNNNININETDSHHQILSSSLSSPNYTNEKFIIVNENKFREHLKHIKLLSNCTNEQKRVFISGIKQLNPIKNSVGFVYNSQLDIEDDQCLSIADITFNSNPNLSNNKGDVILLSNNFTTIVSSICHARNIYDSIRKFIQFQLTVCIVTVTYCVLGNFYYVDAPLSTVQMLWINIIMDALGAFALATDKPENEYLLKYKPYSGKLFNQVTFVNIATQSIYQLTFLLIFLLYGHYILGVPSDRFLRHHQWNDINGYQISFSFHLLISMTVVNMINCRKVHVSEKNVFRGILYNKYFITVVFIIVLVQEFLVMFGGRFGRMHPMSLNEICLCWGIASISLLICFCSKLFLDDEEIYDKDLDFDLPHKKKIKLVLKKREGRNLFKSRIKVVHNNDKN